MSRKRYLVAGIVVIVQGFGYQQTAVAITGQDAVLWEVNIV